MPNSKFEKIVEFLHPEEVAHSSEEGVLRLQLGIQAILSEARDLLSHSWVIKAKNERESFWNRLTKSPRHSSRSRSEMLDALKILLGSSTTAPEIRMHFRNKTVEQLTDSELASLLEDAEILHALEESLKGKKNGPRES